MKSSAGDGTRLASATMQEPRQNAAAAPRVPERMETITMPCRECGRPVEVQATGLGATYEHELPGAGILARHQAVMISRANARRWALRATPAELSTWEACGRDDCEYCVEVATVRRAQVEGREVGRADRREDARRRGDRLAYALAGQDAARLREALARQDAQRYTRASVTGDALLAEADRQDALAAGPTTETTSQVRARRYARDLLRALALGEPTEMVDP